MMRSLFSLLIAFILIAPVSAVIGVSPPHYQVNFEPGMDKEYRFDFITDPGTVLTTSVEGDLAKYVTLDKKELDGGGIVQARLKFPKKIDLPGSHVIFITASEVSSKPGFALAGVIKGRIIVQVPYPEQYAQISLDVSNANVGEPVNFVLRINNLGELDITTAPYIDIFDSENKKVERLQLPIVTMASIEERDLSIVWDTSKHQAGSYRAVAFADYGARTVQAEKKFRLGELFIEITSTSSDFVRDTINRFDLGIESFWKDPLNDVYATVDVVGYPISFTTPTIKVEGFTPAVLTGYFDTTGIVEDKFKMHMIVHYQNKTTERTVDVRFKREIDYLTISLVAGLILLVGIVVGLVIWIKKQRKKK